MNMILWKFKWTRRDFQIQSNGPGIFEPEASALLFVFNTMQGQRSTAELRAQFMNIKN